MARKKKEPLDPATKKRRLKRRAFVYSGTLFVLYGAYKFQPIEIDIFPRKLPPKANVDPDSKRLFAKGTRVMVVTAHPDDSEFYTAGTFLMLKEAGADLRHLLHTDGDKAYYFWADNSALREVRRKEQATASTQWGAKEIRFLGYPDGRLRVNDQTIADTVKWIEAWKPDYIFCFDGEYPPARSHQDHRRSGDITLEAAKRAGFKGWMMLLSTRAANYAVGIDKVWEARQKMIEIHASQFSGKKLEFIQGLRMDNAVEEAADTGATYGEAFRVLRL